MKRKTNIPPRIPLPPHPDAAIRQYYRHLNRYVQTYIRLARGALRDIVPGLKDTAAEEQPRTDAWRFDENIEKKVRQVLDYVETELSRLYPDASLQNWIWAMIDHTNNTAKRGMKKTTKAVGVDAQPFLHDRGLRDYFQNIVDENVGLIRSITREKQEPLKNGLVSLITADAPASQIAKMIQDKFNTSKSKARMIARDQVGKLNGRINQYRQQQLGGRRYIWRGSRDERERADHLRLEGTIQSWDKPPIVDRKTGRRGHPGEDYQCRCRAEMVLEDVLE